MLLREANQRCGLAQVFEKKVVTLTGFNADPAASGSLSSSPGWSISARHAPPPPAPPVLHQ